MSINLEDLRESNEFLNQILDNMEAAVLIADQNSRIHQFNKSFSHLFDNAAVISDMKTFGEITGCVSAVLENKACGETSACKGCVLNQSIVQTMTAHVPVDRKPLQRIFYIKGIAVEKYLRFTTRRIQYQGRTMILIIIYDVSDIERQKAELERKQMLIDMDMKAAATIQQSLLPLSPICLDTLRAAWKFVPSQRIGGDIFNIHQMDRNRVGLYMLDVCGHGVTAALISVAVSQFLLGSQGFIGTCCEQVSPATVLNNLEKAFPFERFDSYFSIVCMTIDVAGGLLTYGSAGHPPPLLVRADGAMQILSQRGPIIGLSSGAVYTQEELGLRPGDKILLYTDGIMENRAGSGQAFGKERFYKTLQQLAQNPVNVFVDEIYSEMQAFMNGNSPDDDISLLGLEYTGESLDQYAI